MLALWIAVTFLRPALRAYSNANRAMRVEAYGAALRSTASICAASLKPDIRSERSLERGFDLALPAGTRVAGGAIARGCQEDGC